MDSDAIAGILLDRYGVRAETAMRDYVAKRWAVGADIPILAGDARTGLPVRRVIVPAEPSADASSLLA